MKPQWDIFCRVVDNYGDAGVCWRLARQFAAEHAIAPRLWIDRPEALARMISGFDPAGEAQAFADVEIRHWRTPFPDIAPGRVVIEGFGCDLPAAFAERAARAAPQPVWINLEYLSAEAWVERSHALPSPHPRLPIRRWFYFPGFTPATGGLLRERGLLEARDRFEADPSAQDALWHELKVPPRAAGELRVSLFCYDTPAVAELVNTLAARHGAARLLVPEGVAPQALGSLFGPGPFPAGRTFKKGTVDLHVIPFVPQDRYDRLLWACDVNIARGEDSFVRAQWAGRPLVWAIYPQSDDAHRKKLAAFLDRYTAALPAASARAVARLHEAWETGRGLPGAWADFEAQRPALAAHGRAWGERLAAMPDLARNIVGFASRV